MWSKYLWQFTEVPGIDVSTDALVGVLHVLTHISESIGSSQQREELVLLGLVVQDLGLRVSAGQGRRFQEETKMENIFSVQDFEFESSWKPEQKSYYYNHCN